MLSWLNKVSEPRNFKVCSLSADPRTRKWFLLGFSFENDKWGSNFGFIEREESLVGELIGIDDYIVIKTALETES